MKSSLPFVLFVELGFAIWLAASTCTLRTGFVDAIHGLREHPSSTAAAAEFQRQQYRAEMTPFVLGACVFGMLALPTIGLAALRHHRSPKALR